MSATDNSLGDELDVLVVGAGFAGLYHLYQLRKLGYSVKLFESGSGMGGVWHWNCYPGARVDSETPLYEFSIEEVWKDWRWKERFPERNELVSYFRYVGEKLDLKKDISFNTRVTAAHFDANVDRWNVTTDGGNVVRPRFLILAVGFAAKRYVPDWPGLDKFQGVWHHTANWPQEGVDVKGKRVGVIGTGSTGVQVITDVGPRVKHLTVFQRSPAIALPMNNSRVDDEKHRKMRELSPIMYRRRLQTTTGHNFAAYPQDTFSATPEERYLLWEELWSRGGLNFAVGNYRDVMVNQEANDAVYAFWRDKIRKRLNDPVMQEKLVPTVAPYPFGTKRPVMEGGYYEVFNQSNVNLVDVNETPIQEITTKGIRTGDGVEHELDILVVASGFDSLTGGIIQIDIRGLDGTSIKDKWANGVYTHLGMTTANFPNMFFLYGPQSPAALSNGPASIEMQSDWVIKCIQHMKKNKLTRIEATPEAEEEWRNLNINVAAGTLLGKAKSWYNGSNIPGKVVEPLNFAGGLPYYYSLIKEKEEKGYEGFKLSSNAQKAELGVHDKHKHQIVNGFAKA
ncbi:FAD dependent oxidoreductase [Dendrothele bispora CBS 962.96]|uniref:FAD dependent oxidoreductase n=1 Tax=Dendrothele bispora (strain CBS 962.96) TaxID=1314807 RepID=A0A4V4HFS2_DENBC|nr:FAD dependent oxidoreductase [Dendrothele bispora CBS 962.96]